MFLKININAKIQNEPNIEHVKMGSVAVPCSDTRVWSMTATKRGVQFTTMSLSYDIYVT